MSSRALRKFSAAAGQTDTFARSEWTLRHFHVTQNKQTNKRTLLSTHQRIRRLQRIDCFAYTMSRFLLLNLLLSLSIAVAFGKTINAELPPFTKVIVCIPLAVSVRPTSSEDKFDYSIYIKAEQHVDESDLSLKEISRVLGMSIG